MWTKTLFNTIPTVRGGAGQRGEGQVTTERAGQGGEERIGWDKHCTSQNCGALCLENIFGIGDCTSVPTSRTAAACAAESAVLVENLVGVVRGHGTSSSVCSSGCGP